MYECPQKNLQILFDHPARTHARSQKKKSYVMMPCVLENVAEFFFSSKLSPDPLRSSSPHARRHKHTHTHTHTVTHSRAHTDVLVYTRRHTHTHTHMAATITVPQYPLPLLHSACEASLSSCFSSLSLTTPTPFLHLPP